MEPIKNIAIIVIVFGGLALVLYTNSGVRNFFSSVFYGDKKTEYYEDVMMFLDSRNVVFKAKFYADKKADVLDIAPMPGNPSLLYAATTAGVYYSADGGANWREANLPKEIKDVAVIYRIFPDPQKPYEMSFLASKDGKIALYKTADGFLSAQKLFEMETGVFNNIASGRGISTMVPAGGKIFIGTSK